MYLPKNVTRKGTILKPRLELCFQCFSCKKDFLVEVPEEQYNDWRQGALVQEAFPEMPVSQRELFVSGMCGECFDDMFAPKKPYCPRSSGVELIVDDPFDDGPRSGDDRNQDESSTEIDPEAADLL